MTETPILILASASAARAAMLRSAGVVVHVVPAEVDESIIKREMQAEGAAPHQIAARLAREKAIEVSVRHRNALVLGADQVLVHDGSIFDKPVDRVEARAHLTAFSGDPHDLISAAAVVLDGAVLWEGSDKATLAVRTLSPGFIDWYLDQVGDDVLSSVGAYHLEGLGAQLFDSVYGDYFTVLGLPLLQVLEFLRRRGMIPQ